MKHFPVLHLSYIKKVDPDIEGWRRKECCYLVISSLSSLNLCEACSLNLTIKRILILVFRSIFSPSFYWLLWLEGYCQIWPDVDEPTNEVLLFSLIKMKLHTTFINVVSHQNKSSTRLKADLPMFVALLPEDFASVALYQGWGTTFA